MSYPKLTDFSLVKKSKFDEDTIDLLHLKDYFDNKDKIKVTEFKIHRDNPKLNLNEFKLIKDISIVYEYKPFDKENPEEYEFKGLTDLGTKPKIPIIFSNCEKTIMKLELYANLKTDGNYHKLNMYKNKEIIWYTGTKDSMYLDFSDFFSKFIPDEIKISITYTDKDIKVPLELFEYNEFMNIQYGEKGYDLPKFGKSYYVGIKDNNYVFYQ